MYSPAFGESLRFPNIFDLTWVFYSVSQLFPIFPTTFTLRSCPFPGTQDLCCASGPGQSNGPGALVGGKSTPSDFWKEHFQAPPEFGDWKPWVFPWQHRCVTLDF